VPFLLLGYGRLTCTLYLCPVFGEYYNFNFQPYMKIRKTAEKKGIEMWVFIQAMTTILVKDYFQNNQNIFNKYIKNREYFIGVGFDDGDIYLIKK
jgi:hypothetical protein